MADILLAHGGAIKVPGETFPEIREGGTNAAFRALSFDATTDEAAQLDIPTAGYTTGDLTFRVAWRSASLTTGAVVLGASVLVYDPGVDATDLYAKAWAAEATVTSSHGGTVGQLHEADIVVSALDGFADGKAAWARIRRLGTNGSDTLGEDCELTRLNLIYS